MQDISAKSFSIDIFWRRLWVAFDEVCQEKWILLALHQLDHRFWIYKLCLIFFDKGQE